MNYLNELNTEQRNAVEFYGKPLIIYAGAGTGKTKVITYKIAHLIKKIKLKPFRILAVTFTNKAANEMKNRIRGLVGIEADDLWMSTFHSFGFRLLIREYKYFNYSSNFSICDDSNQKALIKKCGEELKLDLKKYKPSFFQHHFSVIKSNLLNIFDYINDVSSSHIAELLFDMYKLYEKRKKDMNLFDFDDLISLPVKLLKDKPHLSQEYSNRFDYILVDEFQDTNKAQFKLLKCLSVNNNNITVVGDDDQSIYSWRGACANNILDFKSYYKDAHIIKLIQNYRSSQTILDISNKLISYNTCHVEKKLFSTYNNNIEPEWKSFDINFDEVRFICEKILELKSKYEFSNIAIFYRTNSQSRLLEEELLNHNIPYIIVGNTGFYQRKEIKDILAYLKFIINTNDNISLGRIINVPKRAIGSVTLNKLFDLSNNAGKSIYEIMKNIKKYNITGYRKIENFFKLVQDLILFESKNNLSVFIDYFISRIDYINMLKQNNDLNKEDRIENVNELINGIKLFHNKNPELKLYNYIESISLISDIDEWHPDAGAVNLMTLHSAKGLEFDVVFITGLNEGLMPHYNSLLGSIEEVEEERRLCYVGITRAKEQLFMSSSETIFQYGKYNDSEPSRFIYEIYE